MSIKRYRNLVQIVAEIKPQKIMEIGTCTAGSAKKMIQEAVKHREGVVYYGFDLFETTEASAYEMTKVPLSGRQIRKKLDPLGAHIVLYKGNTRKTLWEMPLPQMDLIFIDGGHTFETIQNDWNRARQLMHDKTVIVFDDYWTGPALTHPIYRVGGCKPLIDNLKGYQVEILEPTDKFPHLWANMVRVQK